MSIIRSVIAFIRKVGDILGITFSHSNLPPAAVPQTTDDLLKLLRDDKVDSVADYLTRGGDPNIPMNLNGRPIFFALSGAMVDLLIDSGAEVDTFNDMGHTAAHLMASEDRRLSALQHLIKAGANPNLIDQHFETPLDVAHRQNATASAAWLESSGASMGPLATYRRFHPLLRNDQATRPAGPMPSLVQPIPDRGALWQHLRDLIRFWDPTVDWPLIERAATAIALDSHAEISLPAACLEFYRSGIFDWLSWKGSSKEPVYMRCSWATADVVQQSTADELIPVMQDSNQGLVCIERDEFGNADPVVRYAPRTGPASRPALSGAHRLPPNSFHTGCRFSEFVAITVYSELAEMTPARRYVDLESSQDRQAVRLREQLKRVGLPRFKSGLASLTLLTIYEGPDLLYVEIESPSKRQGYYGILGGDSQEVLDQLVEAEETDDLEEQDSDEV